MQDLFSGSTTKYGERTVDLAVDGWAFSTNCGNNPQAIERSLANVKEGLETRVEDVAYYGTMSKVLEGDVGIYLRGKGVKPGVPKEIIGEARAYLNKGQSVQSVFLTSVYQQIVESKGGDYATRFEEGEGEIGAILHYFIDKMRGLGLIDEANKIEAKVLEKFPEPKRVPFKEQGPKTK